MKRRPWIIAAVFALTMAVASPAAAPDQFTSSAGEKTGEDTYHIASHGITVTAPAGWRVVEGASLSDLLGGADNLINGGKNGSPEVVRKLVANQTTGLFTFHQQPPDSGAPFLPATITGIAEGLLLAPGINTGKDYLLHMKPQLERSPIPTVVESDFSKRTIGGHVFDRMDVVMVTLPDILKQRQYATVHGREAVVFIVSYKTDEELAVLDKVLDSIKLDW